MRFLSFKNERHLEILLLGIAIALGALHAWAGRYTMNPDGISYLDMGDALWRRDWEMAINPYWSPLYALILGLGMEIVQPSLWAEFPLAHAINFLIYLAALFAFRFFFSELWGKRPGQAWLCFGYALFLVAALNLITLSLVSPDMLIAALVFALSGFMARMYHGDMRTANFIWFGILLGLAYLTKAIFFPLGFIFLGAAMFFGKPLKVMAPRIFLSLLLFLSIASIWIVPLSLKRGHVTFGEAGRLTHAWHVNGVRRQIHWQGEDNRFGSPLHPTRKIFDNPLVYEFAGPIKGTYPPWYNPSYWYEGMQTSFSIRAQIEALLFNTRLFYEMLLFYQIWSVLVGFSAMFVFIAWQRFREGVGTLSTAWPLVFPSFAAIGMYLSVVVQPRYVASFLVVIGITAGQRLFSFVSSDTSAPLSFTAGVFACLLFLPISFSSIEKVTVPISTKHQYIAAFLRERGLEAGDTVAVVGDHFYAWEAAWARLARVTIIAEVPPDVLNTTNVWMNNVANFWINKEAQSRVLALFEEKGARMVLAGDPLPGASLDRWQKIEGTNAYLLFFRAPQENQMKKEEI